MMLIALVKFLTGLLQQIWTLKLCGLWLQNSSGKQEKLRENTDCSNEQENVLALIGCI